MRWEARMVLNAFLEKLDASCRGEGSKEKGAGGGRDGANA